MSYAEERSIAGKAKTVIDARTDANVHAVRPATGTATHAIKNFSSAGALDAARHEAATGTL